MNLAQFIAGGRQTPFSRMVLGTLPSALPHHQHPSSNAHQTVHKVEHHDELSEELPTHSLRQKQVLAMLAHVDRVTHQDVAERLNISKPNARALIRLMCLRNRLMPNPTDSPVSFSIYAEGGPKPPAKSDYRASSEWFDDIKEFLRGKEPQRARVVALAMGIKDTHASMLLRRMHDQKLLVRSGKDKKYRSCLPVVA